MMAENIAPFCCLLSALFLYCKGHDEFNPWLGKFLALRTSHLANAPPGLAGWSLFVICSAFYCSPTLTMDALVESKHVDTVFETLIKHKDYFLSSMVKVSARLRFPCN